jgi:hypothetical protein
MLIGLSLNYVGGKIYIYGGQRGGKHQAAFYCFDIETSEMDIVDYHGQSPAERSFHQ